VLNLKPEGYSSKKLDTCDEGVLLGGEHGSE